MVEALAVIQEHTTEQIHIPDLTEMTRSEAGDLARVARLLQLSSYQTAWTELVVTVDASGVAADATSASAGPLVTEQPLVARIGTQEIGLGVRKLQLASAKVAEVINDEDGHAQVRFIPGDDPTGVVEYVPAPAG